MMGSVSMSCDLCHKAVARELLAVISCIGKHLVIRASNLIRMVHM